MKLIVCLSNNNGMMFNHRRQSRDKVLVQKIMEITNGKDLVIHPYSQTLFHDKSVSVSDSPCLTHADFAFVEDAKLIQEGLLFDGLILCKWNRDYPADQFFTLDMSPYELVSTEELIGSSHGEITIEHYQRV